MLAACTQPAEKSAERPPDYVPDADYHILMGEVALQRGDYPVTAQEFAEAAKLSADPAVAARAAQYSYDYGFDRYAFSSASRWVELAPDNPTAHGLLALLLLRRDEPQQAYNHLERSLPPKEQREDNDYLGIVSSISGEGSAETTLAVMQMFADNYGPNAGASLALAEAAIRAGAGEVAMTAAQDAIAIRPEWQKASAMLCRGQLAIDQKDAALDCMRALLQADDRLDTELEYVRLLVQADQVEVALDYLDDMEERRGFLPEIARMHGLISFDQDHQVAAWSDFNKLLKSKYFENESLYYLGRMSQKNREYLPALRYFSRIRSGYLLVSAQVEIAQILADVGNLDGGIQHLDEFYKQIPTLGFELWTAKAALLSSAGRFDQALDAYARALEYQPDNINLLLGRAAVLDESGDYKAAIKEFRAVLKVVPDHADAMNALGYTLANRGKKLGEAQRLIDRALEQHPDSAAYLDSKGWLLFRKGELDAAETYLERAYALDENPEIAAHLGELMWAQGRDGEASIIWMLALETHPTDRALINTIERFRQP